MHSVTVVFETDTPCGPHLIIKLNSKKFKKKLIICLADLMSFKTVLIQRV